MKKILELMSSEQEKLFKKMNVFGIMEQKETSPGIITIEMESSGCGFFIAMPEKDYNEIAKEVVSLYGNPVFVGIFVNGLAFGDDPKKIAANPDDLIHITSQICNIYRILEDNAKKRSNPSDYRELIAQFKIILFKLKSVVMILSTDGLLESKDTYFIKEIVLSGIHEKLYK